MNLNTRDKLILVVVLVIVIWVAGIVSFIKPAIDDVKSAQNTLDAKEVELAEKQAKLESYKTLDADIDEAYKHANETGEVFYQRMVQYEAATIMQSQLDVNNDDNQEIVNSVLTISALSKSNLSKYVYVPQSVSTKLDSIIAQMDVQQTETASAPAVLDMSAYNFSIAYTATKADVIQLMENLQSNPQKSLVIDTLTVSNVGENDDAAEWSGDMSFSMYMIPQLRDPAEVKKEIEKGTLVVEAVAEE